MSVLNSIMTKIFGHGSSNTGTAHDAAPVAAPSAMPPAEAASAQKPVAVPSANPTNQAVDVEATLSDMAAKAGQPLNWRTSIVDLMKLLGLDSSLDNRKALASELRYDGDPNDSAAMNMWLHKQVMAKLAENGGKVPADLRN